MNPWNWFLARSFLEKYLEICSAPCCSHNSWTLYHCLSWYSVCVCATPLLVGPLLFLAPSLCTNVVANFWTMLLTQTWDVVPLLSMSWNMVCHYVCEIWNLLMMSMGTCSWSFYCIAVLDLHTMFGDILTIQKITLN